MGTFSNGVIVVIITIMVKFQHVIGLSREQ
jgi:hypothetical protein